MADNVNLTLDESKKNSKKKTVRGSIKLAETIKVKGGNNRDEPVKVKVVNKDPLTMNVANDTKNPLNINLLSNKRPDDEFTVGDFFGTIKKLHDKDDENSVEKRLDKYREEIKPKINEAKKDNKIFDNRFFNNGYKLLRYEIETGIDEMFPNKKKLFKFSNYSKNGGGELAPNHIGRTIKQQSWEVDKYPPGLELIYNYWMDEGFVTLTLMAITERYRNRPGRWSDNLRNLTLDPLRSINNLLMGYIKDLRIGEILTREERSLEYQNQYGYFIPTKNRIRGIEIRSNFHTAFNKLLIECHKFYNQVVNRLIDPDAFSILTALQGLNNILATGDINQALAFAKLARIEIIIEQDILGRSEVGEYLKERPMVSYKYNWMRSVDAMKTIQRWNPDSSIRLYTALAEYGEIILLGVRFIDWSNINDVDFAKAWAMNFKNEIQGYTQKYFSVTNVDILKDEDYVDVNTEMGIERIRTRDILPSVLIRKRKKQHAYS